MDKNVAVAVVFLCWISVADVSHARFRYLAEAPPQTNTNSPQVSGENKHDPDQIGPVKKPENVKPSDNLSHLDPKPLSITDLVSPPQNQIIDDSKTLNVPNPGSPTVQDQTVNDEGTNNKDDGKNGSPPDKGKNLEHANGTDLLSPDKGKNPERVNGTDLLSPSPEKKNVNGTDLLSPSPVKKHVNGTNLLGPVVNEMDNGKDGRVREKDIDDKSTQMNNGKSDRVKDRTVDGKSKETENGKNDEAKEKIINDKSSETDNGKNGGGKEKTIDDKSIEMNNGKNSGEKEKTINDKSNKTENGKDDRAKEKTIDDKRNETDNGKNGGVREKTGKSTETDDIKNGGVDEKTVDVKSNETEIGKNGGVKEKNIDDKSMEKDNGKNDGVKEKSIDDKNSSDMGVNETCKGLHECTDLDALVACIQSFDAGSRELTVLVQNNGEKTLTVNLAIPTAVENPLKPLRISKHQTQKINISLSATKNTKLILNAGNGECVLHTDHSESEEKFFIYLPSSDKLLTPINGAYFLILSVLIFGGTWACCKCRKRRFSDGVSYQELEMGLPQSVSATNVDTAEGWDDGWDDDWDENNAVKSPGASRIGSISANGLTSRSPKRDGWENDWDE